MEIFWISVGTIQMELQNADWPHNCLIRIPNTQMKYWKTKNNGGKNVSLLNGTHQMPRKPSESKTEKNYRVLCASNSNDAFASSISLFAQWGFGVLFLLCLILFVCFKARPAGPRLIVLPHLYFPPIKYNSKQILFTFAAHSVTSHSLKARRNKHMTQSIQEHTSSQFCQIISTCFGW